MDEPVIVFHHIPKCYGTSLRKYFREFLTPLPDYVENFDDKASYLAHPYDPARMTSADFLIGHFNGEGYALRDRYPDVLANPRFKIFTFLRDPLEMQKSVYYYTAKRPGGFVARNAEKYGTLESYLRVTWSAMAQSFPCTPDDYASVLDRYFLVGVTERLEESLDHLLRSIREIYLAAPRTRSVERVLRCLEILEPRKLPHQNRTVRDGQEQEISDETMAIFRERNALDYAIYRYALERLDREAEGEQTAGPDS